MKELSNLNILLWRRYTQILYKKNIDMNVLLSYKLENNIL